MTGWLARDARRTARQIATHTRRCRGAPAAVGRLVNKKAGALPGFVATLLGHAVIWGTLAIVARTRPHWLITAAFALWAATLWSRHMLRPRVRRAFKDAGLEHPPHITPRTIEHTPYGYTARLTLKAEHNIEQLTSRTSTLRSNLGVREVTIEPHDNDKGRATLDVVEQLPWTPDRPNPWPWANATELSVWEPVPIATDMRLQPIHWPMCEPGVGGGTLLVGGVMGSGKSNVLHLPTAVAALDPNCDVAIFDGKLAEHHDWRHACRWFVGPDLPAAIRALEEIERWVDNQYAHLAKLGRRHAVPGDRTLYWLCDEWARYTHDADRDNVAKFVSLANSAVGRGRAVGLIAAFGTLKPSHDAVPTSTRDLLDLRIGFRCKTPEASDMVIGKGMVAAGYDSRTIPRLLRGVGYIAGPKDMPELGRSYWLSEDQVKALAERAPAPHKPPQAKPAPQPQPQPAHAGNGQTPLQPPTG